MDAFDAFFLEFFQKNIGGINATVKDDDSLSNDLGFCGSDLDDLEQAIKIHVPRFERTGDSFSSTVGNLKSKVLSCKQWSGPQMSKVQQRTPQDHLINMSGASIRTEQLFVAFLREWKNDDPINRDTLLSTLIGHSKADNDQLLEHLQSRWPSIAALPKNMAKLSVAGLMGFLGEKYAEWRKWDFHNGPRGG